MDAYLEIARQVLSRSGEPLHSKAILREAFLHDLVPDHLHGKTQWKTLQARLSEEIRQHPLTSEFVRTNPGIFHLRSSLADGESRSSGNMIYRASARAFELESFICLFGEIGNQKSFDKFTSTKYSKLRSRPEGFLPIIQFCIFERKGKYLGHRPKNRMSDPIKASYSLGFSTYILPSDENLFDNADLPYKTIIRRLMIEELGAFELMTNPDAFSFTINLCKKHVENSVKTYTQQGAAVSICSVDLLNYDPVNRAPSWSEMRWVEPGELNSTSDEFDLLTRHFVLRDWSGAVADTA